MRYGLSICIGLFILCCHARAQSENSINLSQHDQDSIQALLQYYDSLHPDSNYLTLEDSLAKDSIVSFEEGIESYRELPEDDRASAILLPNKQKKWVFALLVLISLLIGMVRYINPAVHDFILSRLFVLKDRGDDDEPKSDIRRVILVLFFVIQCMIFAFALFGLTPYKLIFTYDNSILDYLLILTLVMVIYLLKYFAYRITGDILSIPSFSTKTILLINPMAYLTALFLFPLCALMYYNQAEWVSLYIPYLIAGIIALYIFYRAINLLLTTYRNFSFYKIYLFIYLCTIEIVPALLLWREWLDRGY